jgi:hypothetical protein
MCAGTRVASALALGCFVAATAQAQELTISASSAPPPATAPAPGDGAPPVPAPVAPVPAFTPGAGQPFTPPAPVYAAPAYVAPVYATSPPALPPPSAAEQPRDARYADAHSDHVILMPTAETHPAGTFYLSSYELIILQAGYAISDRVQATLTFLPIVTDEAWLPFDLSLKGVLVREGRVRVAAIGSVSGLAGFEERPSLVGRVGGATQFCFDDRCRSSGNFGSNLLLLGNELMVLNAAGAIFRLTDVTALLAEVQSAVPLGRDLGRYNGLGAAVGIRFSGRRWGVDLSLEAPLTSADDVPQLVPIVTVSYRTEP